VIQPVWLSCTSTCEAWLMPASSLWMDRGIDHRVHRTLALHHGG
jgi:hypothetical protein